MKKVLIIAYYFPPMGTGGVQRTVKFAKYLPEFGWQPVIITVKNVEYYSYDYSLSEEIKDIKTIRTFSLDPLLLSSVLNKIFNKKKDPPDKNYIGGKLKRFYNAFCKWIFIIDTKVLWIPFAVIKSIKIIKNENIQAVFTTSPPNSAHIAGLILKKIMNLKWTADFRDYWIMDGITNFPSPIHKSINNFIRRKIIKNADHIVAVSKGIIDEVKMAYKKDSSDYSLIMNGFDTEDFPEKVPEKKHDKFRIIHSGTFNYVKNPTDFFSGLELAFKENSGLKNDVLFMHIGISIDYDLISEAKKRGLENIIIQKGYLEHKKSIKRLLTGDLLFFTHSDFCYTGMVSAKIFEYLASGIPILAVIPDGEAADLIKKYNSGSICKNKNIENIKNAIILYYEKWKKNKNNLIKDTNFQIPEELKQYSRKNQTKNLKNILEKL
ncbi:glycosyltransferase [candidate division KSB1 bacterium]